MEPRDFAQIILRGGLRVREVHEGYNFHFGHKAAGNVEMLTKFGQEMGFEVVTIPKCRCAANPFQVPKFADC